MMKNRERVKKEARQTNRIRFWLTISVIGTCLLTLLAVAIGSLVFQVPRLHVPIARAQNDTIAYQLDRSGLPLVNTTDLTLRIFVGDSQTILVEDMAGNQIPFTHNSNLQTVELTTDLDGFKLMVGGYSETTGIGTFEKVGLKEGKAWAYSHSFDDNYHLEAQIETLTGYNFPATLYLIAERVSENDLGAWEIDAGRMVELLEAGWSIGNHTWSHEANCTVVETEAERVTSLIEAQNRLEGFIQSSNRPNYRIISFATPCGGEGRGASYSKIVGDFKENQQLPLLFNESNFGFEMDVSSPYDFTATVSRDGRIDGSGAIAETITETFDGIAGRAANDPETPLWYNTFSHGSDLFGDNSVPFAEIMAYLDRTYGPNGSDEVWIAPADEIYSYLLVRDLTVVSISESTLLSEATYFPFIGAP